MRMLPIRKNLIQVRKSENSSCSACVHCVNNKKCVLILDMESIKMTLIHFTQLIFICNFFFSSNILGSGIKKIVLKFYIAPLSNKNISLLSAKGYSNVLF